MMIVRQYCRLSCCCCSSYYSYCSSIGGGIDRWCWIQRLIVITRRITTFLKYFFIMIFLITAGSKCVRKQMKASLIGRTMCCQSWRRSYHHPHYQKHYRSLLSSVNHHPSSCTTTIIDDVVLADAVIVVDTIDSFFFDLHFER